MTNKGLVKSGFALSRCAVFRFFEGTARPDEGDAFAGRGGRAAVGGGRSPFVVDDDIIVDILPLISFFHQCTRNRNYYVKLDDSYSTNSNAQSKSQHFPLPV